jgi:ferredoxin--NADP+ reductase
VAIVGSGPAACYAAQELLTRSSVEVEMFERLPTPWGLVRAGVAPDHQSTKGITELFASMTTKPGFRFRLNVEIGTHISHEELLAHHHAVVYAHGASSDRRLDIAGEDLPGSAAATEFVNWYNGHPDYADRAFDLDHERAVIVGNGNVALDIARLLVMDVDQLSASDMARHAVEALRNSQIDEVVILGRRGPAQAAYTSPELLALQYLPGVDVIVDPTEIILDEATAAEVDGPDVAASTLLKLALVKEFAEAPRTPGNKRIVLRFLTSPVEILGEDRVTGVRVVRNELLRCSNGNVGAAPTAHTETIEAGLVLRSIGYRGVALRGVPFDETRGVIPNQDGRVIAVGGEGPVPGVYTTGWIKRGPSGVIGTNKKCAQETVICLLEDFVAGKLPAPGAGSDELSELIRQRQPLAVGLDGWLAIDAVERERGIAEGKVRDKLVDIREMLAVATGE